MSLLGQTLILYLLAGIGVAGAVYLRERGRRWDRWFRVASAVPFWPLYVPLLLARPDGAPAERIAVLKPADEMDAAIARVEAELEMALGSLDGWAEDVLARERGRIGELRAA